MANWLGLDDAVANWLGLDDAAANWLGLDDAAANWLGHRDAAANWLGLRAHPGLGLARTLRFWHVGAMCPVKGTFVP